MIFNVPIKTKRLVLKKESIKDFPEFYKMVRDPQVMKYIGEGSIVPFGYRTGYRKYKEELEFQNKKQYCNLAVYTKYNDRYIGWCGIVYSPFLEHIELGYRYTRRSWGKGYATEAGHAVLRDGYSATDLDRILACVHPENAASIRVLEKLGFSKYAEKYHKGVGSNVPVYEIKKKWFFALPGLV